MNPNQAGVQRYPMTTGNVNAAYHGQSDTGSPGHLYGVGSTPDRQPQVEHQVNRLREAVAGNDKFLSEFESRLSPLIAPIPRAVGVNENCANETLAPLADSLRSLVDTVESNNRRLGFLLGNIEI